MKNNNLLIAIVGIVAVVAIIALSQSAITSKSMINQKAVSFQQNKDHSGKAFSIIEQDNSIKSNPEISYTNKNNSDENECNSNSCVKQNNSINCKEPNACDDNNPNTADFCNILYYPELHVCKHINLCGLKICKSYEKCVEEMCIFNPDAYKNLNVAIILVNYSDSNSTELTPELFEQFYVPRMKQYWIENSNNYVTFRNIDVYGWYALSQNCTLMKGITEPKLYLFVTSLPKKYDKYIFIYNNYCASGGHAAETFATVGYSDKDWNGNNNILINKSIYEWDKLDGVLNHEFGHTVSLMHSGALLCSGTQIDKKNCIYDTYANHFDVMGEASGTYSVREASGTYTYYKTGIYSNAVHLYQRGWLSENDIIQINNNGEYTIGSLKNNLNKPKTAKFSIGSETYFLEWRDFSGFEANIDNFVRIENQGIFVNVLNSSVVQSIKGPSYFEFYPDESTLLDLNKKNDSLDIIRVTLNEGNTYTDSKNGFSIRVINKQNDEITFFFKKFGTVNASSER